MSIPAHQFSYEEFHAFVMLYAANADGNISEKEEVCATSGLSKEQCAAVKQVFEQCDDNETLQVIFSYQDQYLATADDHEKVLADMRRIFEAEGGRSAMETVLQHMFKRLLNGD